jgi:hypothetical protein
MTIDGSLSMALHARLSSLYYNQYRWSLLHQMANEEEEQAALGNSSPSLAMRSTTLTSITLIDD